MTTARLLAGVALSIALAAVVLVGGALTIARSVADDRAEQTFTFTLRLTETLRTACERANARTRESNRRLRLHAREDRALELLADAGRDAYLKAWQQTGDPIDRELARKYDEALQLVRSTPTGPLPLVDCRSVYRLPTR